MAKLLDLVNQLVTQLPRHTDMFSDIDSVASVTFTSTNTLTVTTASTPVVSNSQYALLPEVYFSNTVASVAVTGTGYTRVVLNAPHDVTNGDTGPLIFHELGTTNTFQFDNFRSLDFDAIEVLDEGNILPSSGIVLIQRVHSLGGVYAVGAVNGNEVTLSSAVPQELIGQTSLQPSSQLYRSFRISRTPDFETAQDHYTEQSSNAAWLFVVLDPTIANKDRGNDNDAISNIGTHTAWQQKIIFTFTAFIFFPTDDSTSGAEAIDAAQDLRQPIYRSLLGMRPPTGLTANNQYAIVPLSDQFVLYNSAYLVYSYTFQTAADIVAQDVFTLEPGVRVRGVDFTLFPELSQMVEGTQSLTASIDTP